MSIPSSKAPLLSSSCSTGKGIRQTMTAPLGISRSSAFFPTHTATGMRYSCCTHVRATRGRAARGSWGPGEAPSRLSDTVLLERQRRRHPPSHRPLPHFRCKVHIWLISIFGGGSVSSPPKDSDCMTNHVLDYGGENRARAFASLPPDNSFIRLKERFAVARAPH